MSSPSKTGISRVAVIGAGASGLAAVKYLLAEKKFTTIQAYEQRATPGGVWNYTPLSEEKNFSIPQTRPSTEPDEPIETGDGGPFEFIAPVYDQLETNIPHSVMSYSDQLFPPNTALFPGHGVVLEYLKKYAQGLEPYIQYETQVLDVRKLSGTWEVEILNLRSKQVSRGDFDAVVIASGHFNVPYVPDTPGLVDFDTAHAGIILHSKFYRRPDAYAGKKVVVIGNSASGVDLTAQLTKVAKLPVIISEKERDAAAEPPTNTPSATYLPVITQFITEHRSLRFANGHIETDVDAVIFCTGFHYSYHFLQHLDPPVIAADGGHVGHLWENLLYSADPTLAFLSVPQRGIPFPLAESQSAVISRIWSGRLEAPTQSEMESWVTERRQQRGEGKSIHLIKFPEDVQYMQRLYDFCQTAGRDPGLFPENEGVGKLPALWDERKIWIRGKVAEIKQASRLAGDARHEIMTPEELGFNFDEERAA